MGTNTNFFKSNSFLLILLFTGLLMNVFTLQSSAQNPSIQGALSDSVANLYQKYLNLEKQGNDVEQVKKNLQNVNQNLSDINNQLQTTEQNLQQLQQQQQQFGELEKAVGSNNQLLNQLDKDLKNNGNAIQNLGQTMSVVEKGLQNSQQQMSVVEKGLQSSEQQVKELQKTQQKIGVLEQQAIGNKEVINNLGKAVDNMSAGLQNNEQQLNALRKEQQTNDNTLQQKAEANNIAINGLQQTAEANGIAINGLGQSMADINNALQNNTQLSQQVGYNGQSLELLKASTTQINQDIGELKSNYEHFNTLLKSNNEAINKLTNKNLFTLESRLETERNKIINTADFVHAADISLSAIVLSNALSDYLNDVSALNNPENQELGFSLSNEVSKIIDKTIIKGKGKVNNVKTNKFFQIVDNVIRSPITRSFLSAIPVVNSIKSVMDLVIGVAVKGKDITVGDIANFKLEIGDYIEHYEGLARATTNFDTKLNSIKVRTDALKSLLKNYTVERVNTLQPNTLQEKSTEPLAQIIAQHYNKDIVTMHVNNIANSHQIGGRINLDAALADSRLFYPTYALNQARLIQDEIEAISKEYILAFYAYQKAIEMVLNKSKKIGNANKINAKVQALKKKLEQLKVAYNNAVRIDDVKNKFRKLSNF